MPSPDCLPEHSVHELVEGRLTGANRAAAERHVASCAECQAKVATLSRSGVTMQSPGARRLTNSPLAESVSAGDPAASVSVGEPLLEKNERVGRYVIQGLLGAGAMGRVYAAHDPSLDRRVALKLLRPDASAPDLESRLLREAKAMARITHPHVVSVYDAGRHGSEVYVAMELVEGGTLRDWLRRSPRTWREILDVFLLAGEGLAEAHREGLVHRDFKPDNVLVGSDDKTVRVTDFGLARAATVADARELEQAETKLASDDNSSLDSALTHTGALVGTPLYMAPEQYGGASVDARVDLYAFCAALYEALYDQRPFVGSTVFALHASKVADQVRAAPKGTRVPPRIGRLLAAGMRADRERRPASMDALLASLRRAARRPRWAWALGVAAPMAMVGVTLYASGHRGRAATGAASQAPSASAAVVGSVCSNAQCARDHGGAPWVCGKTSGQCVAVENERCKAHYEPGDLEADDTVWLGALLPMTGPLASVGKLHSDAAELGRREFAEATRGLTGPNASLHVRRVAVVTCDDAPADGVMDTAKHLVDDVGVPAIFGFRSGQEVSDLAGAMLIRSGVVSIATLSNRAFVTQVPQPLEFPRMIWRTTFGMDDVAVAVSAFIADYFEPRRSGGGPTRVTLVRDARPGSIAFGQTLLKSLRFNGKSGVDNGDAYQEVAVASEEPDNLAAAAAKTARRAPAFVVFYSPRSIVAPLIVANEASWPRGHERPLYLLASDTANEYAAMLGSNGDLRRRLLGIVTASNSASNAHFVIRFNEANVEQVTRTENPGSAYDALYLLAYAANAVATGPLDGPSLARAFSRLAPPGRPVEVGPGDILEGLSELAQGRSIDLNGASSSLDLDPKTGEIASDYAVNCAAVDERGRAKNESIEPGLSYLAGTRQIVGQLRCP